MAGIKCTGLACAVLLLLTAIFHANADEVTWKKCKHTDVLSSRVHRARTINSISWDLKATSLYLAHCNIRHLANITGLPKVKNIVLSNNNLHFLNPEIFKTLSQLKEVDLSFNRLSSVPVFGQHGIFESMKKLLLSNNRISLLLNLETFASMRHLQELNLDNNLIRLISADVFKPLENLRSINLASNKISYIPDGIFQLENLESIFLNDNAIGYVSPTAFGTKVLSLDLSANRLSYLPKDFLLKLTNKSNLKNFKLASNPWQCACIMELLNDVKKLGVCDEYYEYVFNGGHPLCLSHEKKECHRPSEDEELLSVELANDHLSRSKPYPVCS